MQFKRSIVAVVATAAFAVPTAAQASEPVAATASYCSLGAGHVSYNRMGTPAWFGNLRAAQSMNCASARYVMNKWLRRSYRRSYANRLPTRFYDGYVKWYCSGSSYSMGWRCQEYESYTAFRFNAYTF